MDDLNKANEGHLDNTLRLLSSWLTPVARDAIACGWAEAVNLQHMGSRIWHDTLKSILAFGTRQNVKLSRMKSEALKGWREYGAVFGWRSRCPSDEYYQPAFTAEQRSSVLEDPQTLLLERMPVLRPRCVSSDAGMQRMLASPVLQSAMPTVRLERRTPSRLQVVLHLASRECMTCSPKLLAFLSNQSSA